MPGYLEDAALTAQIEAEKAVTEVHVPWTPSPQADRTMNIALNQHVETRWIDIDCCVLGNRTRMDFAAIERSGQRLLQMGHYQSWPPIVGIWEGARFVIMDGRHEYLALLALGRTRIFVGWTAE